MNKFTPLQIRLIVLKLSQTEMGKLLNMSRHKYALRESGKSKWHVSELELLIKVSGLEYDQIQL